MSSRLGQKTAIITFNLTILDVSCNPAMGGLGKGHLIREIDALGGLIKEEHQIYLVYNLGF